MSNSLSERPLLPESYFYREEAAEKEFHAELQRELAPGHLLYGVRVQIFATRDGTDDVLFQHLDQPERFTVVHLTWRGRTEISSHYPAVLFDGTLADFLASEEDYL